jgi:hypothetical protein
MTAGIVGSLIPPALSGKTMPFFRAPRNDLSASSSSIGALTFDTVRVVIAEVMQPGHFFVGPPLELEWQRPRAETVSWEIFHGRLLDPAHTRLQRSFEAWSVFQIEGGTRSAEPLLSVKLDADGGQVHVVRAIHCYAWEGYRGEGNVFLSRETQKWVRELVGTIHLDRFGNEEQLRDELICLLFLSVVGKSRLPLTSLEAPLPAFSFGQLAYCYRPKLSSEEASRPMRSCTELMVLPTTVRMALEEQVKLLETLLHVTPLEQLVRSFEVGFHARTGYLFRLFNQVSLSPWTDLVDRVLILLTQLEGQRKLSEAEAVDFLSRLLRHLCRHLTAYDLITFHHRGANYPDALLLDALLKTYVERARRFPALLIDSAEDAGEERDKKRLRRRALRQAWLVRSAYEGHRVPDVPTSQGENIRVLPEPHARVPQEQILEPQRRARQLYANDPLESYRDETTTTLLERSIADLQHPLELRELGMALFLDRPLGAGKAPVEPDTTPLLSYEAFSRTVAERRVAQLADRLGLLSSPGAKTVRGRLAELTIRGIPLDQIRSRPRPGTVSLADARLVAGDFLFLRTTFQSLESFWLTFLPYQLVQFRGTQLSSFIRVLKAVYEPRGPHFRTIQLLLRDVGASGTRVKLTGYDDEMRPWLELDYDPSPGYISRAGIEFPADGLHVLRVWDQQEYDGPSQEFDLRTEGLVLRLR